MEYKVGCSDTHNLSGHRGTIELRRTEQSTKEKNLGNLLNLSNAQTTFPFGFLVASPPYWHSLKKYGISGDPIVSYCQATRIGLQYTTHNTQYTKTS
jgi:hypothetical protein